MICDVGSGHNVAADVGRTAAADAGRTAAADAAASLAVFYQVVHLNIMVDYQHS